MNRKKISGFEIFNAALMIVLMAIMIYPVVYVFSMSVSEPNAVMANRVKLFPIGFSLQAYKMIFSDVQMLRYYANTILYAFTGTAGMLAVTMMAAYAMTRKHFFLRGPFTTYMAITMFFGGGLIPSFMVNKTLGLYNNIWIMILPGLASAWNIIVARVFIQDSIGESLVEAAQIDGYNDLQLFFAIIMPLSTPIIAYLALNSLVGHWNSYFNALIYLPNRDLHPIQLFLMRLLLQNSDEIGKAATSSMAEQARYTTLIKYASIIVTIAPILCAYPFLQKYFVKGIMIGAIKG